MIGVYTQNIGGVWFGVACDKQRVYGTSFASGEQEALRGLLSGMLFNVPFQVFSEPSAFAEEVLAAVKSVFDGNGVSPSVSLATEHLSAYTQKVLAAASLIPMGYVTSYGAIAKAAGGSPRAVGNVMACNPFAPIVPCHRVVRSDLTLGGYGGGPGVKLAMLGREKRGCTSKLGIPVSKRNMVVFPVERVLEKMKKKPF